MSTLKPREPYSAEELKKLYPENLELKQVQIFLRHGERTPTSDRFGHLGLPKYWPFCNASKQLTGPILNNASPEENLADKTSWSQLSWRRQIETQGPNDLQTIANSGLNTSASGSRNEGICTAGELTDLGRQTTLALGQRLRNLYVTQLNFLPPNLTHSTPSIYLRSTHMSRALESLQQAFSGLYPPQHRAADYIPTINTRRWEEDQLFPNNRGCPRFNQLYKEFSKRAAAIYNDSPEMNELNSSLQEHMPSRARVAVDGHPALVGLMDTNNARRAHGLPLPKAFNDQRNLDIIDSIAVKEWFSGYAMNREYRAVGIGGLIGDINENITRLVEGDERAFSFSMNGCHDTTLAGMLSSLGAFEGEKWPFFTSHIAWEVFRVKDHSPVQNNGSGGGILSKFSSLISFQKEEPIGRTPFSELTSSQRGKLEGWYIRGRYNDRPVVIPGCKPAGRHLDGDASFCTLAAFKEICDKFVPVDWKAACQSNLGKGIVESEDIPAGH